MPCFSLASTSLQNAGSDMICGICTQVFRDPVSLPCCHLYCRRCVDKLPKKECPTCEKEFEEPKTANPRIAQLAKAVRVCCKSCRWVGSREESFHHEMNCPKDLLGSRKAREEYQIERLCVPKRFWKDASDVEKCHHCSKEFNFLVNFSNILFSHKKNCTYCGEVFCSDCLKNTIDLPPHHPNPVPSCDTCYTAVTHFKEHKNSNSPVVQSLAPALLQQQQQQQKQKSSSATSSPTRITSPNSVNNPTTTSTSNEILQHHPLRTGTVIDTKSTTTAAAAAASSSSSNVNNNNNSPISSTSDNTSQKELLFKEFNALEPTVIVSVMSALENDNKKVREVLTRMNIEAQQGEEVVEKQQQQQAQKKIQKTPLERQVEKLVTLKNSPERVELTQFVQNVHLLIAQEERYGFTWKDLAVIMNAWLSGTNQKACRFNTLCGIEFLLSRTSSKEEKISPVEDFKQYFLENPEYIQRNVVVVEEALKEKAQKILQILGVPDRTQVANQQQQQSEPAPAEKKKLKRRGPMSLSEFEGSSSSSISRVPGQEAKEERQDFVPDWLEKRAVQMQRAREVEKEREQQQQQTTKTSAEIKKSSSIDVDELFPRATPEQEAAARMKAEQEEAARMKAEQEEAARMKAEQEEAARMKAEQEAAARKKAEQEEATRMKAEQEEAAKKKKLEQQEEAARKKLEQEEEAEREKEEDQRLEERMAAETEQFEKEEKEIEKQLRKVEGEEAAIKKLEQEEEAARKKLVQEEEAARRELERLVPITEENAERELERLMKEHAAEQEEAAKQKKLEETARTKKLKEEAARKKADQEKEEEAANLSSSPTINNNNAAINVANSAEGTSTTAIANSTISGSVTSVSNSENVNIDARNFVENVQNKTVNNNNTINYITQNIIQQQQVQEKSSSPLLAIRLPRVQKKSLELDDDNEIGSGSTCTVYQSEYENQEVAVKIFQSHVYANSTVQREIENLLFLQHPNIIRIFALVVHKPKQLKSKSTSSSPNSPNSPTTEEKVVGIICELLGENLQDYLVANHSSVSPIERLIWARQIASAISCAHRNKVAHSDIKPENILLSQTAPFICHLSDFGSSSVIKTATAATATSSVRSTPGYLAPELIADEGTRPTAASDIFSFGGVLWFLFHPNVDHGLGNTSDRINFAVVSGKRPPISTEKCPTEVATLIEECWCQKPDARPHVGNVLKRISDLIQKEKN